LVWLTPLSGTEGDFDGLPIKLVSDKVFHLKRMSINSLSLDFNTLRINKSLTKPEQCHWAASGDGINLMNLKP